MAKKKKHLNTRDDFRTQDVMESIRDESIYDNPGENVRLLEEACHVINRLRAKVQFQQEAVMGVFAAICPELSEELVIASNYVKEVKSGKRLKQR